MKILKTVKKIPGGLMVVPLLLGAIINTVCGGTLWTMFDGTFTTYLWKSGRHADSCGVYFLQRHYH